MSKIGLLLDLLKNFQKMDFVNPMNVSTGECIVGPREFFVECIQCEYKFFRNGLLLWKFKNIFVILHFSFPTVRERFCKKWIFTIISINKLMLLVKVKLKTTIRKESWPIGENGNFVSRGKILIHQSINFLILIQTSGETFNLAIFSV